MLKKIVLMASVLLTACTGLPEGVEPVKNFEPDRYLGTWYEIARLDHRFERGMSHVTAEYALRGDGSIRVINRGYDTASGEWKEAQGKAYPVNTWDEGHLKVSFFGPFYGSYAVFDLDQSAYQYAFVAGNSTDYLWLLARSPSISDDLRNDFINRAKTLGFPVEDLIFVDQQ